MRYLRSIFIPADNTCFHVFEAPSLQTVREMSERASIGFERIVRVVQIERAMMPGSDPPGSDPATAPGRVVV